MKDPIAPSVDELLDHGAWLRRLARSLTGAHDAADDLVQETWLAALRHGPERREDLRGWLGRVLRNRAVSQHRSESAGRAREQDVARSEELPPTAELASRAEVSRRLVELVLELPSDQQRILLARYFEDLSSAEIARRLDRPAATVRSQLKRGLDALRERMDRDTEGGRSAWLNALVPLSIGGRSAAGAGSVMAVSGAAKVGAVVLVLAIAQLVAVKLYLGRGDGGEPVGVAPIAVDSDSVERDTHSVLAAANHDSEPSDSGLPADVESAARAIPAAPIQLAYDAADGLTRRIQGQLLSPSTMEPVVWFELGIVARETAAAMSFDPDDPESARLPDEIELVTTDEQGRFETEREYATGSMSLVLVEDWRTTRYRLPDFEPRRTPRPSIDFEHAVETAEVHTFELESGAVFRIDCANAREVGWERMCAIYSHIDHFPPGYFAPSPVLTEPVPFVRMREPYSPTKKNEVSNLRLVSIDGFWSGSVPLRYPTTIETRDVSIVLNPTAVVNVDIVYPDERRPSLMELDVWSGTPNLELEEALDPEINEFQARINGRAIDVASTRFVAPGLKTLRVVCAGFEPWIHTAEVIPGENQFEAVLQPDAAATGIVRGEVVHVGDGEPPSNVTVQVSGTLDGVPKIVGAMLVFEERGGIQVAGFEFERLPVTDYMVWFGPAGEIGFEATSFVVEPNMIKVESDGDLLEFELRSQLTETKLRVRAVDAATGEAIRDFKAFASAPETGLHTDEAQSKLKRVDLELFGDVSESEVWVIADGYATRHVPVSTARKRARMLELEVELTRGWTAPVFVRDSNDEPIEGVEVLVDGVVLGVSDSNGVFRIENGERPRAIEVRHPEYQVESHSGPIQDDGTLTELPVGWALETYTFVMQR